MSEKSKEPIDIAFVIDACSDMAKYNLKKKIFDITTAIKKAREKAREAYMYSECDVSLRVRLILFSSFATTGENAIQQTEFFNFPEQTDKLDEEFEKLQYDPCWSGPKNGHEALFVAMKSDWTPIRRNGFHIIIVMTNKYPLNLQECVGCYGYVPDDYPASMEELEDIWRAWDYSQSIVKRKILCLIVPEGTDEKGHSWENVAGWEQTIFLRSDEVLDREELAIDDLCCYVARFDEF